MTEPLCPNCKQHYPPGWTAKWQRRKSLRIKKALAESDKTIGRPRKLNYKKIYAMRADRKTFRQIAVQLNASVAAVYQAWKRGDL
jgi:hypothetical protein